MPSFFEQLGAIVSAVLAGDSWMISEALNQPAAYLIGAAIVLGIGWLLSVVLPRVPFLDRNVELAVLVGIYLTISAIIFVEVIRRFVFQVQAPWSTTLPPYLFLIMTWVGCTYNVKLRSHLSFSEFRSNMPRSMQLACLVLDAVLWLGFSIIVVVTTLRLAANSAANFQILLGTDNVMQWWFYIVTPVAWTLLAARAIENLREDFARYRTGEPLVQDGTIGE